MDDLISRQKAKDAIDMALDHIDHVPSWVYDKLLNALNEVPPGQSELSNNSKELENKNGELISRQAAIDAMRIGFKRVPTTAIRAMGYINELPCIEPREKGHWVGIDDEPFEDWECDRCGYTVFAYDVAPIEYNFCPNCGADMREGDSDEKD